MEDILWIISYENAHFCGGSQECVVWAKTADEAELLAADFMEQEQRELFADHYSPRWDDSEEEDYDQYDNEQAYSVNKVQPLIGSEFEKFYNDPTQRANFYPCVNGRE